MPDTLIPPAVQAAIKLDAASGTYTVADLARLLQCSERHVWRQIDIIPGKILFGRLVRFSRAVVDGWLAGRA
jgi:hypothetical protein